MLELIFAGVFIAIVLAFANASLFATQKVVDLIKPTVAWQKYFIAGLVTALVVFVPKLIGVGAVFGILLSVGYAGIVPEIPAAAMSSWLYFIIVWVLSYLVSGGWYDWRKDIKNLLPTKSK